MADSVFKSSDTLQFENAELTATVRLLGAELCSLRDRATGDELIWQNPTGEWAGSSPILFPVVGRVRSGGFLHADQRYAMGTHGFASRSLFDSCSRNAHGASLALLSNASTLQVYPFEFALQVDFALQQRSLRVSYTVRNRGLKAMFFSLGAHPAFSLPLHTGALSDWRVVFDTQEREEVFRLAPDGALLASAPEPFAFAPGNAVFLSDTIFERDALIFKNIRSRRLSLVHQRTGQRIVMETGGAPHLGLWAKPGARYVCIEPWWGVDDDARTPLTLADKSAMQHLAPGAARVFTMSYSIGTET